MTSKEDSQIGVPKQVVFCICLTVNVTLAWNTKTDIILLQSWNSATCFKQLNTSTLLKVGSNLKSNLTWKIKSGLLHVTLIPFNVILY